MNNHHTAQTGRYFVLAAGFLLSALLIRNTSLGASQSDLEEKVTVGTEGELSTTIHDWLDPFIEEQIRLGVITPKIGHEMRREWITKLTINFLTNPQSKSEILDLASRETPDSEVMRGYANLFSTEDSPCDVCTAAKILSRLALKGSPEAYLILADLYLYGKGVKQSIDLGCYAVVRHSQIYGTGLLEEMEDITRQMQAEPNSTKRVLSEPHLCDAILPKGFPETIERDLELKLRSNIDIAPCPAQHCRAMPADTH